MVQAASVRARTEATSPRAFAKLVASGTQSESTNDAPFRLNVTVTAKLDNNGGTFLSIASGYIQIEAPGWYKVKGFAANTSGNRAGDRNTILQKTTGTPTPASDTMFGRAEVTADQNTCHQHTGTWTEHFVAGERIYLSFVQHTTLSSPFTIAFNEDSTSPYSWLSVELYEAD